MICNVIDRKNEIDKGEYTLSYNSEPTQCGNASVKLKNRRVAMSNLWGYVTAAICAAAFGAIYEYFSFGVYSYYMIYAFLCPLVLGGLPWMIIATSSKAMEKQDFPPHVTINLWNTGVATLTVGSIFRGVLDIYGTTSVYSKCYLIVGAVLLIIAMMTLVGYKEKQTTSERIV